MASSDSNRHADLKSFDESKLGVKGLVDSGLTHLPKIFHLPPQSLPDLKSNSSSHQINIPLIDLSSPRQDIVAAVKHAASEFGFFQVINHPIPAPLMDRFLDAIRRFNEVPASEKARFYCRDSGSGVTFFSNADLFVSKAASWRDTFSVKIGPDMAQIDAIPQICREEVVEWNKEAQQFGELLMGYLSEGLGLSVNRLKEMACLAPRYMRAQYYPCCPQSDLTLGLTSHSDPSVFTVLLQDQVGGLQVKYEGSWIDVKPIHGALVVNVGDVLQIISNDEYKSVDHRVLANPFKEARIAIATFFNPDARDNVYGPLPELVSDEKPALYREFMLKEFLERFFSRELDGKSLLDFYKLQNVDSLLSSAI